LYNARVAHRIKLGVQILLKLNLKMIFNIISRVLI